MKKLCFVVYDNAIVGGVGRVTASLANAFAQNYEVHILSLCGGQENCFPLDERVITATLLPKEDRLRTMRSQARKELPAYFREHQIDVAFFQGNYPGFIGSAARFHTKTKLVFADHGALMNQWDRKDIVVLNFIASLLCHKTVVLTDRSLLAYRRKFHTPRRKLCRIYNWYDLQEGSSLPYDAASRKIISAGRFGKEKGFDMLVKAFAPVAKKHPDWSLDLYGDGEMMEPVLELISQLGITHAVNLMGMRSDLPERYRDYAMYVLPSYREGFPLVLLEAKGNSLPIVSFDITTGPAEMVRDGVDGILVPPYKLEQMGEAMNRLIEDDDLRIRMADVAKENLKEFSKETIMKEWELLIDQL